VQQYFPDGAWCTILNKYSTATTCFTIYDQEQPTTSTSDFVFLRDGAIIALQDTSDGINNSQDLKDIFTDIHLSFSMRVYDEEAGKLEAEGLLFTDPPDSSEPENYCLTYFTWQSDNLGFNEVGYVTSGTGLCSTNPAINQNILGRVYIYN